MGIARLLATVLPHLSGLRVQHVAVAEHEILGTVVPVRRTARCPLCQRCSRRLHARFTRLVADLPWHGHAVQVCLHGRRFRCTNDACARQTFRERLPQLAPVYSRRTPALHAVLEAVGFALGGQPGARLARVLRLPVSRMTLLRLLHMAPAAGMPTPRVLSVDDWVLRRGRSMARSSWTSSGIARSISCRIAPPRRWPTGYATIRASKSPAATGAPWRMPSAFVRAHRTPCRWPTASTCSSTSATRWRCSCCATKPSYARPPKPRKQRKQLRRPTGPGRLLQR